MYVPVSSKYTELLGRVSKILCIHQCREILLDTIHCQSGLHLSFMACDWPSSCRGSLSIKAATTR